MGLGLHGGGVACVNWLIKHGAKVTVTDLKSNKELRSSVDKLVSLKAVNFILGRHREIDFKNADFIIQNPGVPKESKYLKIARNCGIPIENDASLFFKYCPAKIIGVTGTRGKSTTATLIFEILKASKPASQQASKIWLAGLPQKPMLEILDKVKPNDAVILELSSWQLEILGEQKLSPHIAVITNIYPDHLNRYSGMGEYIKAKKNIIAWQKNNYFSVLNCDNLETKKIGQEVKGKRFWFSKKYFSEQNGSFLKGGSIYFRHDGKVSKLASRQVSKLKGDHNLENILAASTVVGILRVKPISIKKTLTNFSGLPGRIELIGEIRGVKYINDTTATTPDGTIAALRTLQANIILIAGGDTKNIPDEKFEELSRIIKQKCKAVILFSGKGSGQLFNKLKKYNFKPLASEVADMSQAVGLARSFAKPADIILLSPACSSFNMFSNEYDRGNQFNKIIRNQKDQ